MTRNINGYATDIPYLRDFKTMLAPAWLDHVALVAEPEVAMAEVLAALSTTQPGELYRGNARLAAEGQLGASPLRDGDVLSVGRAEESAPRRSMNCSSSGGLLPVGAGPCRPAAASCSDAHPMLTSN